MSLRTVMTVWQSLLAVKFSAIRATRWLLWHSDCTKFNFGRGGGYPHPLDAFGVSLSTPSASRLGALGTEIPPELLKRCRSPEREPHLFQTTLSTDRIVSYRIVSYLVYHYEVVTRPVMEYACPIWHSSLTSEQSYMHLKQSNGELFISFHVRTLLEAVNTVKTVVYLTWTASTHDANNRPRYFLSRLSTALNIIFTSCCLMNATSLSLIDFGLLADNRAYSQTVTDLKTRLFAFAYQIFRLNHYMSLLIQPLGCHTPINYFVCICIDNKIANFSTPHVFGTPAGSDPLSFYQYPWRQKTIPYLLMSVDCVVISATVSIEYWCVADGQKGWRTDNGS